MFTQQNIKFLSVIVPAYKQEKTIEEDLKKLHASLSLLAIPYEIIVVVDGYTDKTAIQAKKVKVNNLHVIGYEHNHGKGYAVRYGMARAKGDVIIFVDAGGDISYESISMLIQHYYWYAADIIVGSKRHPASKIQYPWTRKVLSFGYQIVARMLFGLHIRDTQVGLKLYKRQVLEDVLPRLLVKKFAFDIEILAVAFHLGYTRIYEAPVELDFSGVSSITSKNYWQIVLRTLWDTVAVFYRLKILKYYDTTNKRRWRYDPELDYKVNVG